VKHCFSDNISVLSALEVLYDNALYKSTFYLLTYLLYSFSCTRYIILQLLLLVVVVVMPLTYVKALIKKVSFWRARTSSESSRQARISRSSGQSQGHRSKNAFAGGLPSIER